MKSLFMVKIQNM